MGFWGFLREIFFDEPPKLPPPKPPPPTHIQSLPTPDSAILGKYSDLNTSIKQHVESFYTSDHPGQRREIGMTIFGFILNGFNVIIYKQLDNYRHPRPYQCPYPNLHDQSFDDICKIGKSLQTLLHKQPHGIWKVGSWEYSGGYIVVFPSIWKGEVLVRNREIVESR